MKIYVWTRADGTEWADFTAPSNDPVECTRVIRVADERADIQRVIAAETGRVRALAQRALKDLDEQLTGTAPQTNTFGGRVKWLFTGK